MHPIYIEATDEITTVIERMKNTADPAVALVIPRGSILVQSIVNLKLAKKAAADLGKSMTLVTTDKIGKNLAGQVGLSVVAKIEDIGNEAEEAVEPGTEPKVIAGVKVHRYYDEGEDAVANDEEEAREPIEPIIPKKLMKAMDPAETAAAAAIAIQPTVAGVAALEASPATTGTIEEVTEAPAKPTHKKKSLSGLPSSRKAVILSAYVLLLLLLGAGAVGAFYLPQTTVTVTVPSEAWQKEVAVSAKVGANASSSELTLPAEMVTAEAEEKMSFKASGTKDIGEIAKGTATLYNYDSTGAETVPAGTKIVASGKSFTTQDAVTVPGFTKAGAGAPLVPGSKTVAVVADEAGEASNLTNAASNEIKGSGYSLSGTITAAGGTTKQVAVVTATDIANAKVALTKKLQDSTKQKLADAIKDKSLIFQESTDTFALESFAASVLSGTQADSADATAKATLKRLTVNKDTLRSTIQERVTADAAKGTNLAIESVDPTKIDIRLADQAADIVSTVKGHTLPQVDTNLIRNQLVGKNRGDASTLVGALVKDADVHINQRPSWWPNKNFPYSPKYLDVSVTYE